MKRIIICFDGTWNDEDDPDTETNICKIARAIPPHPTNEENQIALYLSGVGTSGTLVDKAIGGATGLGVLKNIRTAYRFIAQHYVEGDEIYIFGFSRGAFTARSLVGMISNCGLVDRKYLHKIPEIFNYYTENKDRNPRDCASLLKIKNVENIEIKFLGVFDTVGALGIPIGSGLSSKYQFHDTNPSRIVKYAYHALAIDEFRSNFVPTLWTGNIPDGAEIEQVWFAGAHADIGGGYRNDALSKIPLIWMVQKAERLGLKFDWNNLPDSNDIDAMALADQHNSSSGEFIFERFNPTYRQVLEFEFEVGPLERVYYPMNEDGKRLKIIKEEIHDSVSKRKGQTVLQWVDKEEQQSEELTYEPKNLKSTVNS